MPLLPKRKALDALENLHTKPSKQQRLDAFFLPKVPPQAQPAAGRDEAATIARERLPMTKTRTSTAQNGASKPTLSDEQQSVLKMVVDEGRTIFFTGSAGTGKSLLLRAIIDALRKKFAKSPEHLAVCASTGIAAQNIGGTTIHAWGAVTPGLHDIGKLTSFIKTCRPAHRRWKAVKVLIIDEVSMVDGQLFDTLSALAVELRKKTAKPFGSIQLVVTGDFFQLPPVTLAGREVCFAFQSSAWKSCIERTVTLTQVFRQKDSQFIDLLNEMRKGEISTAAARRLQSLSRPLPRADGDQPQLLPTELFPLRAEVDRANASRLAALAGPPHAFAARDSAAGGVPPDRRRRLLDAMAAPAQLELKPGAQVMLIKNVSDALVNGSVGRVVGFAGDPAAAQQRATSKKKKKKKDGGGDEAEGEEEKEEELLPLVEFETFRGKETVLVGREEFRAEDGEGNLLARRVQVPLALAWAMSIHKAQGQTISRVKVDLNRVFEKGQSYVALSRAASLDGLQVLGFDARKVVAHPRVVEWSKNGAQSTLSGQI